LRHGPVAKTIANFGNPVILADEAAAATAIAVG
jgi:hypothetical protein